MKRLAALLTAVCLACASRKTPHPTGNAAVADAVPAPLSPREQAGLKFITQDDGFEEYAELSSFCASLALTSARVDSDRLVIGTRTRGSFHVRQEAQPEAVCLYFQRIASDSLFVVKENTRRQYAVLYRAATPAAYRAGTYATDSIYTPKAMAYQTRLGDAMPARYFFFEASALVNQTRLMPYRDLRPFTKGNTRWRWFNLDLFATRDSLQVWNKRTCGEGSKIAAMDIGEIKGYADVICLPKP